MTCQCPVACVGAYKTIVAHRCRCRCLSLFSEFVPKRGASVGAKLVPVMPIATCIGAYAKCEADKSQKITISASHCARNTKCKDDRAPRPSTTHILYLPDPFLGEQDLIQEPGSELLALAPK